ncbi:MAG: hypothetical protein V1726_08715 [Methanobacteriota archaeon]
MKNSKTIKIGDTIELISTNDEMTRLQPGDQGTIVEIEGEPGDRVIWIQWKRTKARFALLEEIDKFKIITS